MKIRTGWTDWCRAGCCGLTGMSRGGERDRREVCTTCLCERDRCNCFSKATHVTSSCLIQTSLSYLNSNMFPWLLRGSHVHTKSPNSFLALQVRLGQVVACGSSMYEQNRIGFSWWTLFASSTRFFFWSFLPLFQHSPSSLTIGDPWASLELRVLASLKT